MEVWRKGHRAQPGASAASALPCQSSALPSFIGIIMSDRGFSCTPRRSACHCSETWLLKLSLVVASCLPGSGATKLALSSLMAVPGLALYSSFLPFYPDEQQKVQQFPPSHPAGEQEAVQQGPAGGDGAEPVAEADPARGLRDAAAGDRPQVVL